MIPHFNPSGVIPPFLAELPHGSHGSLAPYPVTLMSLVERFSTSKERIDILNGYLNYRIDLKKVGINDGFQWIDGSFIENVEVTRERPPQDIDFVTFANRPSNITSQKEWGEFFENNIHLFDIPTTKADYFCDAYYIDLSLPAHVLVDRSSYWYGLFSHQRESYLWKGMLKISLSDNEDECLDILNTIASGGE